MEAMLALEDGRVLRGRGSGAPGERFGEVVFNTSLSGYQEILTDPSYAGQIVILTFPHIGNYGTNPLDCESARPYAEGLVVRELSQLASNWRSVEDTAEYLTNSGMPVISDIDTRALVRHLRSRGSLRGVISTVDLDESSLVAKAKASPSSFPTKRSISAEVRACQKILIANEGSFELTAEAALPGCPRQPSW